MGRDQGRRSVGQLGATSGGVWVAQRALSPSDARLSHNDHGPPQGTRDRPSDTDLPLALWRSLHRDHAASGGRCPDELLHRGSRAATAVRAQPARGRALTRRHGDERGQGSLRDPRPRRTSLGPHPRIPTVARRRIDDGRAARFSRRRSTPPTRGTAEHAVDPHARSPATKAASDPDASPAPDAEGGRFGIHAVGIRSDPHCGRATAPSGSGHLPLGDLDAVLVPLVALELDVAREDVLAERLRAAAPSRRAPRSPRRASPAAPRCPARSAPRRRAGRGSSSSRPAARSPSRSPRGPRAAAPRRRGTGCRPGRGSGSRRASPARSPACRAGSGSAPSGCAATRRRRPGAS